MHSQYFELEIKSQDQVFIFIKLLILYATELTEKIKSITEV